MAERGNAVGGGVGEAEGAFAEPVFKLLPSYANSSFLLALSFRFFVAAILCGVWARGLVEGEEIATVPGLGLVPRARAGDDGLWTFDLESGLSDATSTSKMSPKIPLTKAC